MIHCRWEHTARVLFFMLPRGHQISLLELFFGTIHVLYYISVLSKPSAMDLNFKILIVTSVVETSLWCPTLIRICQASPLSSSLVSSFSLCPASYHLAASLEDAVLSCFRTAAGVQLCGRTLMCLALAPFFLALSSPNSASSASISCHLKKTQFSLHRWFKESLAPVPHPSGSCTVAMWLCSYTVHWWSVLLSPLTLGSTLRFAFGKWK